ncbi:MAG: 3-oxoacyl-ACP reductase FabG [Methylobacterium sp.]|nr:MAG: 3-oxoacyl-ACP reductase FabG [Methylobacterium sp.]
MAKLSGKAALVTGGSRGIGAAIARRLAADGAAVAITYTKGAEPAAAVVREIESAGGRAVAIQADAADPAAVTRAVDEAAAALGRLDILVNNAGIGAGGSLDQTTLDDFDRLFAVNVRGPYVAIQAAAKHLPQGGRIINIGSCLGDRQAFGGMAPYSATKSAVRGLTQGLARELGPKGITVNNVEPGPIDTDMNPADGPFAETASRSVALGRYGKTEELAAMVAFVASPEASYVTGANLLVDGGTNA